MRSEELGKEEGVADGLRRVGGVMNELMVDETDGIWCKNEGGEYGCIPIVCWEWIVCNTQS